MLTWYREVFAWTMLRRTGVVVPGLALDGKRSPWSSAGSSVGSVVRRRNWTGWKRYLTNVGRSAVKNCDQNATMPGKGALNKNF